MLDTNKLIWGFDLGSKTLGIAHNNNNFAFAFCTLRFTEYDFQMCISQIQKLFDTKEKPSKIVIGYPINMDGSIGQRAEMIDFFIEHYLAELQQQYKFEVIKLDERLTTKMAQGIMRQANTKAKTKDSNWKQKKDEIAAQLILETFLQQAN